MKYAIETKHFSKSYRDVQAVNDISLQIRQGEIYGFLGLNGAGKTTAIRALLGMIKPSKGTVTVLGQKIDPAGKGPWEKVGYLVENPSAYPNLSVHENLDIARRLQNIKAPGIVDEIISKLDIGAYANRKAGTLSTGNRQRLGLARAVLHKPDLLILDEPSNGLDPAGVIEIRELLADLSQNHGVTIFMSSHILTEVDRLATRIGIIHNGKIIEDLDKEKLAQFRTQRLEIQVRDLDLALHSLQNAGYMEIHQGQDQTISLADMRALETPDKIATLLVNAGAPPIRLAVQKQNLEEHFMELTGAVQ
jgi:ABC-2 type transport system ATP-binding protein